MAEALVSKGYATVVRYRQDDDQRSSRYDELLNAEMKATKTAKGVHDKKEAPTHRVADLSGVSISCITSLHYLLLLIFFLLITKLFLNYFFFF